MLPVDNFIKEDEKMNAQSKCDHIYNTSDARTTQAISEYSKSKSQDENVTLISATSDFFLLIEVQDTGIGIQQETMNVLFSPFKQAQRLAGGTGLGLYSLAKRMEALNGYYGVRARADGKQASIFWFAFPYKPDHFTAELHTITLTEPPATSSKSQHTTSTTNLTFESYHNDNIDNEECNILDELDSVSVMDVTVTDSKGPCKLNILLVDDSFAILKVVSNMLRKHGHFVTEALNGEEALRVLEKTRDSKDMKPFDVVIIDLHMPVMDGKIPFNYTCRFIIICNCYVWCTLY